MGAAAKAVLLSGNYDKSSMISQISMNYLLKTAFEKNETFSSEN